MVGATVFTVASTMTASVAATQENITQQPKDDSLPIGTAETAPSALASVSAPKADKTVKDELPHSATAQNGLAHDDEGQYERKFETVAPAGCGMQAPVKSTVSEPPLRRHRLTLKKKSIPPLSIVRHDFLLCGQDIVRANLSFSNWSTPPPVMVSSPQQVLLQSQ
jgi:hypothetical protein